MFLCYNFKIFFSCFSFCVFIQFLLDIASNQFIDISIFLWTFLSTNWIDPNILFCMSNNTNFIFWSLGLFLLDLLLFVNYFLLLFFVCFRFLGLFSLFWNFILFSWFVNKERLVDFNCLFLVWWQSFSYNFSSTLFFQVSNIGWLFCWIQVFVYNFFWRSNPIFLYWKTNHSHAQTIC